jgi:hypothetical protein
MLGSILGELLQPLLYWVLGFSVMKSNDQLHRLKGSFGQVPIVRCDPGGSSSSAIFASLADVMGQLTIMTKMFSSQGLSIELKKIKRTTLRTMLPEEDQDIVP